MKKLLTLTSATLIATLFQSSSANALILSLNNYDAENEIFAYDLTLSPNESLNQFDPLALTNLSGINNINANSPYSLIGSDSNSANFQVSTPVTSSANTQILENVILLSSSDSLEEITYSAFSSAGAFQGTIQGSVAAVPFEFSPILGLLIIAGICGLSRLRNLKNITNL